jgi:hypothetical protein
VSAKNKYIENNIPALYRRTILDVMIYTFIDAVKHTIPGISVDEAALAFSKKYKIDEDEMTLTSITRVYYRIQKELFEDERTKNT